MTARKIRNEDGTFTVEQRETDTDPWTAQADGLAEEDADMIISHIESEEPEMPEEDEELSPEEEAAKNREEINEAKKNGAPKNITDSAEQNVGDMTASVDKARAARDEGMLTEEELHQREQEAARNLRRQYGFLHRANALFKTIGITAYAVLDAPFRAIRYANAIGDAHDARRAAVRAIKKRNNKEEKYKEAAIEKIKTLNIQKEIDGEPLIDEADWKNYLTKRQINKLEALDGATIIKRAIYAQEKDRVAAIKDGWTKTGRSLRDSIDTLAGRGIEQKRAIEKYKTFADKTADEDLKEQTGSDPIPEEGKEDKEPVEPVEPEKDEEESRDVPAEPVPADKGKESEEKPESLPQEDKTETRADEESEKAEENGKEEKDTAADKKVEVTPDRDSETKPAPEVQAVNTVKAQQNDPQQRTPDRRRQLAEAAKIIKRIRDKMRLRNTVSDKAVTAKLLEIGKSDRAQEELKEIESLVKSQNPTKEELSKALDGSVAGGKFKDSFKEVMAERKQKQGKNITSVMHPEQMTREDRLEYPSVGQVEEILKPTLQEMSKDELNAERSSREKKLKEAEKALKKAKGALDKAQRTAKSNPDIEKAQDDYEEAKAELDQKQEQFDEAKGDLALVKEEIKSRPAEQMQYAKLETRQKAVEKALEQSEKDAREETSDKAPEEKAPEEKESDEEKSDDIKSSVSEKVTDVEFAADLNSAEISNGLEETRENTKSADVPMKATYTPKDTSKMSTIEKFNYNTAESSFHSLMQLKNWEKADIEVGDETLRVYNKDGVMAGAVFSQDGSVRPINADGIMDKLQENAEDTRRNVIKAMSQVPSAKEKQAEREEKEEREEEEKVRTLI